MSYDEYCCGFPARWAFAVPVSGIRVSGLSDLVLPSFKLMRQSVPELCRAFAAKTLYGLVTLTSDLVTVGDTPFIRYSTLVEYQSFVNNI